MSSAPSAITQAFFASASDDDLESQLLNYVLELQARSPEAAADLPLALQAHFIAFVADGEILNGGFNQLFFNDPELALDAPEAFRFLQMPQAARLAEEAVNRLDAVYPGHQAAREAGTIEAFMATYDGLDFDDLDKAYGASEGEFRNCRIAYIRAHPEAFLHPGAAG